MTGSAVSEGYTYALDTYEYLMAMVTRAEAAVTEDTSVDRAEKIILNYPIAADASYKLYGYEDSTGNASPPEDTFSKSNSSCELNMMLPSNITSINYAIAVETKYDNGMPDMIYTNRFYISRGYTDLIQGTWYRDFVLDATNKGFVQGMGDGTFSPESTLTRGQFLVMLLNAADINLNEYDTIDFTDKDNSSELSSAQSNMPEWVRRYMNYAWDNKLINTVQYIGSAEEDGEFTEGYAQELNRAEAAYILYMMFIGNLENIRVPSNIYFYDESISNYKTELWNAHMAFAEQQDENSELNNLNHVEQMYYNGVLEGMPGNADEGDDPNKIYFYPNKTLTRAEACKVVLKCLFELNDDIPEIQANIFEDDVEAVPLPDGDHIKDRYVLDSIPFDATNQILYEFHVDDNKEYAIETTGEVDNTTTWGRLYYVDGNSTINNITLDGSNHMLIVFQGAGDYRLRIKRTGKNDTIGLRISEVGVSDLSAVKREGGNSIFVNSPEYISHVHTLSADTPEYIFSQDNVSGYNVMYATHYLPETDGVFNAKQDLDYENYDNAYYDIEFYNPTNNPVTIKLNSIGYDSTTYGYGWYPMMAISNYYNLPITMESYILGNSAYKEWIPQEPKDILKNLDLDANGNETNEFTVQPGEHYFLLSNNVSWGDALIIPTQRSGGNFIYLYTDFEVLDGKEITVRTAVDYEQNLFMMNCQKENISMGDYKYYDNEIERDIASKVKGIDWGHLPIVDYNMEYIITENTIGENLKQNVIDDAFYQGSELKNNPVDGWSTHINPYFDVNAANDLLMPSGLMEYEYSDSQGLWSFGYDRIIGLGIREDDETGIYKNRQIINDKHPLSQNGKTAYNEIMENLINGTDNYPWRGGTVPTTDPETQINLPQPVIDDAKNGYLYAQSLGEWGVDQYYTVTFRNTYDYDIKIRFCMKSNSPAMIRYNIDGSWQTKLNLGKESEFNTIFEVTIPGKSTKDCEFSYITSAGPGCAEHYFEVGE